MFQVGEVVHFMVKKSGFLYIWKYSNVKKNIIKKVLQHIQLDIAGFFG